MKKTCTDREPVAAPPFMSGDVMIRVLHSESNQAATSVQKTMRVCVLAVSSERSTKNSVYCRGGDKGQQGHTPPVNVKSPLNFLKFK